MITHNHNNTTKYGANPVSKIGTILAIMFSWAVNHSICWAILHAMFGWFYVIYWLFTYAAAEQVIKDTMM